MKGLLLLFTIFFSANMEAQILSINGNGHIVCKGTIDTKSKFNYEIARCLAEDALIGVESYSEKESSKDSAFVLGAWSYTYYINNYDTFIGKVDFKFQYVVKEGKINYKFYDFEHKQGSSEFKSLGLIPLEWDSSLKNSFNKKQYSEILTDIRLNIANALRSINKYCLN